MWKPDIIELQYRMASTKKEVCKSSGAGEGGVREHLVNVHTGEQRGSNPHNWSIETDCTPFERANL